MSSHFDWHAMFSTIFEVRVEGNTILNSNHSMFTVDLHLHSIKYSSGATPFILLLRQQCEKSYSERKLLISWGWDRQTDHFVQYTAGEILYFTRLLVIMRFFSSSLCWSMCHSMWPRLIMFWTRGSTLITYQLVQVRRDQCVVRLQYDGSTMIWNNSIVHWSAKVKRRLENGKLLSDLPSRYNEKNVLIMILFSKAYWWSEWKEYVRDQKTTSSDC